MGFYTFGDFDTEDWIADDDRASNRPDADAAQILGAVVYHSARRGLQVDLYGFDQRSGDRFSRAMIGSGKTGGQHSAADRSPNGDGTAALSALATTALSAYLSAVEAQTGKAASPQGDR